MGYFGRALITCALTAMLAVSPAHGVAAQQSQSAAANPAQKRISIDNFGKVNASYYRGAQPNRNDYHDLAALGIKTVIDLQRDGDPVEQRLVEAAGMAFHRIEMTTSVAPAKDQLSS